MNTLNLSFDSYLKTIIQKILKVSDCILNNWFPVSVESGTWMYKYISLSVLAAHLFPCFGESSDSVFIHQASSDVQVLHLPAEHKTESC